MTLKKGNIVSSINLFVLEEQQLQQSNQDETNQE